MTKKEKARDSWIKETQMFQRIVAGSEDSYEELGAEWDQIYQKHPVATTEASIQRMKSVVAIIENAQNK